MMRINAKYEIINEISPSELCADAFIRGSWLKEIEFCTFSLHITCYVCPFVRFHPKLNGQTNLWNFRSEFVKLFKHLNGNYCFCLLWLFWLAPRVDYLRCYTRFSRLGRFFSFTFKRTPRIRAQHTRTMAPESMPHREQSQELKNPCENTSVTCYLASYAVRRSKPFAAMLLFDGFTQHRSLLRVSLFAGTIRIEWRVAQWRSKDSKNIVSSFLLCFCCAELERFGATGEATSTDKMNVLRRIPNWK